MIEKAHNGDVELAYERIGPPDGTPLLLLMGAGGQLVMWPDFVLRLFVDHGFQVVRMDNRDTGLSTHLRRYDNLPRKQRPAYTLGDVADDAIAVFDALGWSGGHVMGASLGGMIAQLVAARHPDRVRSVTMQSVSPSSSPLLTRPRLRTMLRVFRAVAGQSKTRDQEGEKWAKLYRVMATPALPEDFEHWREAGRLAFDRGLNPKGDMRLAAAGFASGNRRPQLAKMTCPALVVHGDNDGMGHWKAGRATAEAIPGARFVRYPEMSHIPNSTQWPAMVAEISALAARGDAGHRPRGADTHPRR
ncbi:MAG: alpha/beta fold hydrolase [Actinophytocola sp.]|uniref:alpha/beta fold hydrolase n=1 Tax=Actinophytocola sp. TaxID=1872138 RepID=UPI003D6A7341